MRIIGNDPSTPRQAQIVASGTLSTGDTVVVNADGTVSAVAGVAESLSSEVSVAAGNATYPSGVYDSIQNKVLIVYSGVSNFGTAVVGTVSGGSISFGTPVVFISSNTYYLSATFDPSAGNTGVFWADYSQSEYGKAVVATISGTTVSFGSIVTFSATTTGGQKSSTFYASENKILLAYRENTSASRIRAATISGTSISFGSAVSIGPSSVVNVFAVGYDTNAGKALIAYANQDAGRIIDSKVVTLTGTTVSLGAQTTVYGDAAADTVSMAYDSTNNKMVVGYRHDTGDLLLRLIVATLSGTSVTYGAPVSTGVKFNGNPAQDHIHYNVAGNKIVYAARDDGNSFVQKYVTASVSGTSIIVDSPVTYYATTSYNSTSLYDPVEEKSLLVYSASGNTGLSAKLLTTGSTNLTAENFIGTAATGAADAQRAKINIKGAVDENQSGLTAGQSYFVQTDGTLGTTAGDPSVFAGTAVSATKLIVKG